MILAITGMDPFQFDRVVRAIDELTATSLSDDIFIQLGSCTYVPKHCRYERFLSFETICEKIREATIVITHAGAGSTLNCIHNGKHPIIIPRLARYGEAVDDHQIPFAEQLDRTGTATLVIDLAMLSQAIESVRKKSATVVGSRAPGIVRTLEAFWKEISA